MLWMIPSWRSRLIRSALVDDRQLLDLLVEPGVLDRDPGVEREHLDQLLVVLAELGGADLLGQVEVADRSPADADRARRGSECIGGWFGGKP